MNKTLPQADSFNENLLQNAWKKRMELRLEGNKLRANGDKIYYEGNKLRADGDKLLAEGNIIFLNTVIKVHGNIKLEWKNWNNEKGDYECHLETGEVFKP